MPPRSRLPPIAFRRSVKRSRIKKRKIDMLETTPGPTQTFRRVQFTLRLETTLGDHGLRVIKSIEAGPLMQYDDNHSLVECTDAQRNAIGYIGNSITLQRATARGGRISAFTRRTYRSKTNKNYFTTAEIVSIIVKFERLARHKWIMSDDIDRLQFDGIFREEDAYFVDWM